MAIVPIPEKPILPVAPKLDDQLASKFDSDMVRLLYDILTKIARRANASVWIDPGDDQTADRLVAFVGQANKVKSTGTTAADLAAFMLALADLVSAGTGLLAKTGASTYAGRTLTGTANQIIVANGDGIAGDPTVSLPAAVQLKTTTAGLTPYLEFLESGGSSLGYIGRTIGIGNPQIVVQSQSDIWLKADGASRAVVLTGGRLQFPLTPNLSTNPNTLDDYEEGTWTPSVAGTSVAGSASYSLRAGRYLKIGQNVFVACEVAWSGGTGSGTHIITGLPFVCDVMETALAIVGGGGFYGASNYLQARMNAGASFLLPISGYAGGVTGFSYQSSGELDIAGWFLTTT